MKKTLLCILSLSLLLMGCGTSNVENTAVLAEETITLRLLVPTGYLTKLQPYLMKFSKRHPEITVQAEQCTETEITDKINLAQASNNDYDLMWIKDSSIRPLSHSVLAPLDGYLSGSQIDLVANYNEKIVKCGQANKRTYGICVAPGTRVLAYNKKLLAQSGFEPPHTQADMLKIAQALYETQGIYGLARASNAPLSLLYSEGSFWMSNGARIAMQNPDGTFTTLCDSEAMIESIRWWQQMSCYMPKDVNLSDAAIRELFAQGKTVFYIFGAEEYTLLGNMVYGQDYALTTIPGSQPIATLGGWYFSMSAHTAHPDAAWLFMQEYLSDPEMMALCSLTLPGDLRVHAYPPFDNIRYAPFFKTLENCETPLPHCPQFDKVSETFFDYFNRAIIEQTDAAVLMYEAAIQIDSILSNP